MPGAAASSGSGSTRDHLKFLNKVMPYVTIVDRDQTKPYGRCYRRENFKSQLQLNWHFPKNKTFLHL